MPDLPSELYTLVQRYGTRVLDDADALQATLDDFLDEGIALPGDVNLVVDAVRFGSLERLRTLIGQGAEPSAATADVAAALAQRRGGDAESARWACSVLGFASGLLPHPTSGSSLRADSATSPAGTGATTVTASNLHPDGPAGPHRPHSVPAGGPHTDDGRYSAATIGRPPAGPSSPGNSVGSLPEGIGDHRRRRRSAWLLAVAAALAVVLVAGGVYLATRGGGSTDKQVQKDSKPPTASQARTGNQVPVSQIADHFDHFGPDTIETVLKSCVDASEAGSTQEDFHCRFKDQYGPFDLELTERDNGVLKINSGLLPDVVTSYPRGTIITQQLGKSWHAYFLKYVGLGADRKGNTPDDEVRLTLYDVDPEHPGRAVFTAVDSAQHPLTHQVADRLLSAIGAPDDKFPLPKTFHSSPFSDFAQSFLQHEKPRCVPAFTKFGGEQEHVQCTAGDYVVDFGYRLRGEVPMLSFYRSDGPGNNYVWRNSIQAGRVMISTKVAPSHVVLFWDDNLQNRYGTITGSAARTNPAKVLEYFKEFQGGSDVRIVSQ